jgi:hypothetical protein
MEIINENKIENSKKKSLITKLKLIISVFLMNKINLKKFKFIYNF